MEGETEEVVCCNCGSLSIDGEYIDEESISESNQKVVANILANFQTIMKTCPGGIQVNRISDIDIVQRHSIVFDLICRKCKIGYRVILGRDHIYSCPLDDCYESAPKPKGLQLKRPLSSFFPLPLRRFVIERSDTPQAAVITTAQSEFCPTFLPTTINDMEDDADFDIMFSSKQDCIVGSFTDQWIMSPEFSFE